MKTFILALTLALGGCANLSPRQEIAVGIGAAIVVGSIIASQQGKSPDAIKRLPGDICGINRERCL